VTRTAEYQLRQDEYPLFRVGAGEMPVDGITFETDDGSDVHVTAHVGPDRVLVMPGESALGVTVGDDNVVTMDASAAGSGRRLQSSPEILLHVVPSASVQWVRTRSHTCHTNEYVSDHVCVACSAGTQIAAGGDTTGANTACTAILTCTGNTDASRDVVCNADRQTPKAGSEAIEANTNVECCDDIPAQIEYLWEVTPFAPLHCVTECGANPDRTRQVTCIQVRSYAGGDQIRAPADDEASCTEPKPEDASPCDTHAVGTTCDDGNDETMDDVCMAGDVCQGKVQLAFMATFPLDITTLVVPDTSGMTEEAAEAELNSSPVAVAVKSGIATSLSVAVDTITIKSIAAGSVVVEYVIALTASEVVAARDASETVPPTVTIPAEASTSGVALAAVTGDATALGPYAYVATSMCVHNESCSDVCGSEATTAADEYTCLENGVEVAGTMCAWLGPVPATITECCPAADPATCVSAVAVADDEIVGEASPVWLHSIFVAVVFCCIGPLTCKAHHDKRCCFRKKRAPAKDVEDGYGRGPVGNGHPEQPDRGGADEARGGASTPPRGVSPGRRGTSPQAPNTRRSTSPQAQHIRRGTSPQAPSFRFGSAAPSPHQAPSFRFQSPAAPVPTHACEATGWADPCRHGDQCSASKKSDHARAFWHPPAWHGRP
jgi:hypothetical protein